MFICQIKENISLKEKQGENFIMTLFNDSGQNMEATCIPRDDGSYIMRSNNPADGSGNIVWKKQ